MKVMIVEYSDVIRSRMRNVIEKANSNIDFTEVRSCREAINIFGIKNPETIILNLAIPDGGSINLIRRFKNENPSLRVIVFTNNSSFGPRRNCRALGPTIFIDKWNIPRLANTFA